MAKKKAAPVADAPAAGPIPPPEAAAAAAPVLTQASNKFGVSAEVWDAWPPAAREMFNGLYTYMYDNQPLFRHPKAPVLENEQWKTVAWNAAWIAADLSRKD